MPFRAVCRLCLATNVFNYCLLDTPLQIVYEKLTNQPLNTTNMPTVACYQCAAQLRKCLNVMVRSIKANEILTRLLKTMTKHKSIMIDLEACNLTEALTMSGINHIDISGEDTNVKIKEEPQHHMEREEIEFVSPEDDVQIEIKQEFREYTVEIEELTQPEDESSEEFQHFQSYQFMTNATHGTIQEYENEKTGTKPEDISSVSVFTSHVPKTNTYNTVANKIANEKDNYVCKICKKAFKSKESISDLSSDTAERKNKVAKKKRTVCSICGEWFINKQRFNIHLRTHSGKSPYTCATCKNRFNFRTELVNHLRLHATKVYYSQYFKCASCKARFLDRNMLNDHLREHTSSLQSALKPFLKVHSNEKLFNCGSCDKKFIKRNFLIEHLRTHSVVKPFHCTKCTNKFVSDDRLQNHMKIHEPKAFVCTVCGQRFDGDRYLFRHFHKKHPDKTSVVFVQR